MKFVKKNNYLLRSIVVFVGFLFLLFPMGKYAAYGETLFEFDGLELIFGYKNGNNVILGFNVINFIMFLLILVGIIVPTLSIKYKKYALICETIGDFIAAIFYILMPLFIAHRSYNIKELFEIYPTIYIGGALILVAVLLCAYEFIQLKENKNE